MFPSFSFSNHADSGAAHSILLRNIAVTHAAISKASDLSYLVFGELCVNHLLTSDNGFGMSLTAMLNASRIAAFIAHIAQVVSLRALFKVSGIDACSIVANVKKDFGFIDAAMRKVVREAMGVPHLALAPIECAITFSLARCPYPAIAIRPLSRRLINKRPKTLLDCLRFASADGNVIGIGRVSNVLSSEAPSIKGIFRLIALPQMLLANAGAIAALVKDLKRRVDLAVIDQVSDAMRQICAVMKTECSMTGFRISEALPLMAISVRPLAGRTINKFFKTFDVLRGKRRNDTIGLSHEIFSYTENFVVRADRCVNTCSARFVF